MKLEGSCHCGAVRFRVNSRTPYPYNRCYCSICRKTAGGGGYAINIMAGMSSLEVKGEEHITVYRSAKNDRESYEPDGLGFSHRHFCSRCGSVGCNCGARQGFGGSPGSPGRSPCPTEGAGQPEVKRRGRRPF